ncbi:MAG: acetyl/propionyl-CoA carboxylase alpha subunit [Myxococcota bacterium]|jgi:acetyl/propionyl-CoA carboxylase alpha subunit
MFRRILIANRGEVAARVLRTCHRLGVEVVALASAADAEHQWLSGADRVVRLGPARAAQSYLDQDAVIQAALQTHCAAVHPGWGFLAENATFAARCEAAGLTFIGPRPRDIRRFGDKALARATMAGLGMPIIPGTKEPVRTLDEARAEADRIGYPLLLKAVAGGGGRGMRAVDAPDELAAAWGEATAEAAASFGDARIYMERRIVGGRHVEVQVIADRYGTALHLGERECSIQRRHQKVLEEAPSPGIPAHERDRILPLVAGVVARSGYRNAGTVEMLVDADGKAWFMEMNTRLQVEHSVTEQITGVDLVELQLRVAANQRLPLAQSDVTFTGHSIELRLNAEDPDAGFRPSPGRVDVLELPQGDGIRVDTHLRAGDRIPPNYDSMVAKLIVTAADRPTAIRNLVAALDATRIEGITTNIGLHRRILAWEPFVSGNYDTKSLERDLMGGA